MSLFVESNLDQVLLYDVNLIMIELQKLVTKIGLKCLAKNMLNQNNVLKVLHTQKGMLFETVDSVLAFEQMAKVSKTKSSGSQMLLCLYHTGEFVVALLHLIICNEESKQLGPAAMEAYNCTLKCHHSCHNQMLYLIGMHWLPTKQDFMERNLERDELKPKMLAPQLKSFDEKLSQILDELQKFQGKMRQSLKKRRLI